MGISPTVYKTSSTLQAAEAEGKLLPMQKMLPTQKISLGKGTFSLEQAALKLELANHLLRIPLTHLASPISPKLTAMLQQSIPANIQLAITPSQTGLKLALHLISKQGQIQLPLNEPLLRQLLPKPATGSSHSAWIQTLSLPQIRQLFVRLLRPLPTPTPRQEPAQNSRLLEQAEPLLRAGSRLVQLSRDIATPSSTGREQSWQFSLPLSDDGALMPAALTILRPESTEQIEENETGQSSEESRSEKPWQVQLSFALPRLGAMQFQLAVDRHLQCEIEAIAERESTVRLLRRDSNQLQQRLESLGLSCQRLQLRQQQMPVTAALRSNYSVDTEA